MSRYRHPRPLPRLGQADARLPAAVGLLRASPSSSSSGRATSRRRSSGTSTASSTAGGGWRWPLVLFHFAVPFAILLSRGVKRNPRRLSWLALGLLVVCWVDLYWQVAPAFHPEGFTLVVAGPGGAARRWAGCGSPPSSGCSSGGRSCPSATPTWRRRWAMTERPRRSRLRAAPEAARRTPRASTRRSGVRGIVWTAAGILAVTVVAMLVMWWLATRPEGRLVAADRGPTPVAEQQRARARAASAGEPAGRTGGRRPAYPRLALPAGTVLPPAPRLQPSPEVEMDEMLAAEERELSSYGWVDRERGIVRIPIDEAIDRLAAEGLPQFDAAARRADAGAPPESAAAAGGATADVAVGARDEDRNPRAVEHPRRRRLRRGRRRRPRRAAGRRPGGRPAAAARRRARPGGGRRCRRSSATSASTRSWARRCPSTSPSATRPAPRCAWATTSAARPVVLSLVYYDCPMLCPMTLAGPRLQPQGARLRRRRRLPGGDGELQPPRGAGRVGQGARRLPGPLRAAPAPRPAGTS